MSDSSSIYSAAFVPALSPSRSLTPTSTRPSPKMSPTTRKVRVHRPVPKRRVRKDRSIITPAMKRKKCEPQSSGVQCFGGWVDGSLHDSTESRRIAREQNPCLRCRMHKIKCSGGTPCEPCADDILRQFAVKATKAFLSAPPCVRSSFSDVNAFKSQAPANIVLRPVDCPEQLEFLRRVTKLLYVSYADVSAQTPGVTHLLDGLRQVWTWREKGDPTIAKTTKIFVQVTQSLDVLMHTRKLQIILRNTSLCTLLFLCISQMFHQLEYNPLARRDSQEAVLSGLLRYYATHLMKRLSSLAATDPFPYSSKSFRKEIKVLPETKSITGRAIDFMDKMERKFPEQKIEIKVENERKDSVTGMP